MGYGGGGYGGGGGGGAGGGRFQTREGAPASSLPPLARGGMPVGHLACRRGYEPASERRELLPAGRRPQATGPAPPAATTTLPGATSATSAARPRATPRAAAGAVGPILALVAVAATEAVAMAAAAAAALSSRRGLSARAWWPRRKGPGVRLSGRRGPALLQTPTQGLHRCWRSAASPAALAWLA